MAGECPDRVHVSLWTGMAVGLGAAAVLMTSVLLAVLLFRRDPLLISLPAGAKKLEEGTL